jgi:hypothetical protein
MLTVDGDPGFAMDEVLLLGLRRVDGHCNAERWIIRGRPNGRIWWRQSYLDDFEEDRHVRILAANKLPHRLHSNYDSFGRI